MSPKRSPSPRRNPTRLRCPCNASGGLDESHALIWWLGRGHGCATIPPAVDQSIEGLTIITRDHRLDAYEVPVLPA